MVPSNIKGVHEVPTQDDAPRVAWIQLWMDTIVGLWVHKSNRSFWRMCHSFLNICKHTEPLYLGYSIPKRCSATCITKRKVRVWCAGHTDGEVGSYNFNYETVREVDKYKMLDVYALLEAQQLPGNAVFHLNEAPPHFTDVIRSSLDEMFSIPFIVRWESI